MDPGLQSLLKSPVPSLEGSNGRPATDIETATILQTIGEVEEHLSGVDQSIAAARRSLQLMLNERQEISTFLHRHRALISIVSRLPTEILAEIFLWCLPVNSRFVKPSAKRAPMLLTQVSKRWRNVAIAHGPLWASIEIEFTPSNIDFKADLLDLWFLRSGKCAPLSLSICSQPSRGALFEAEVDETQRRMMQAVVQHSKRWRHIKLGFPLKVYKVLTALPGGEVPLLESIHLRALRKRLLRDDLLPANTAPPESPMFPETATTFQKAPMLYSVAIGDQIEECRFAYPISQLIKLDLAPPRTMKSAIKALTLGRKNLASCILRNIILREDPAADPPPEPVEPKVLARLKNLDLTTNQSISSLLDAITVPVLQTLTLKVNLCMQHNSWSHNQLISLLARSQCSITCLSLRGVQPVTDLQLMETLGAIPTLRELAIDVGATWAHAAQGGAPDGEHDAIGGITKRFIVGLTVQPDTPVLVPNLRILGIHGALKVPVEHFVTLIESRWKPSKMKVVKTGTSTSTKTSSRLITPPFPTSTPDSPFDLDTYEEPAPLRDIVDAAPPPPPPPMKLFTHLTTVELSEIGGMRFEGAANVGRKEIAREAITAMKRMQKEGLKVSFRHEYADLLQIPNARPSTRRSEHLSDELINRWTGFFGGL